MKSGADSEIVRRRGRPPKADSTAASNPEGRATKLLDIDKLPLMDEDTVASQSIKTKSVRIKSGSQTFSEPEKAVKSTKEMEALAEQQWKRRQLGGTEKGYATSAQSAYEVLGLQSEEPASRPTILDKTRESVPFMNWAANDCARSTSLLRRARPVRPISASFFDRLEMLRRVILSEIAKSEDTLTAMAVVGVVLDREQLMLSAEEVYGLTKAKALIFDVEPGSYPDIATELDQMKRGKVKLNKRDMAKRSSTGAHKMSKPSAPYVQERPFREPGAEVLQCPRCPGKTSKHPAPTLGGGRHSRRHECAMERMEANGSPTNGGSMAASGCPTKVEGGSPEAESRREGQAAERGRRRDGQAGAGGGLCRAGVQGHLASVYNSEEGRHQQTDTRSEADKYRAGCAALHVKRPQGGGRGRQGVWRSGLPRLAQGLSASRDVEGGEGLPRGQMERKAGRFHGLALWAIHKPVHIHPDNRVAGKDNKEQVWTECSCLYRRFSDRCGDTGQAEGGARQGEGALRETRSVPVPQDRPDTFGGGRVPRSGMERKGQDREHHGPEAKGVQKKDQEPAQGRSNKEGVAANHRQAFIFKRSRWPDRETREVSFAPDQEEAGREAYPSRGRSTRGPGLVAERALTPSLVQPSAPASVCHDHDRRLGGLAGRDNRAVELQPRQGWWGAGGQGSASEWSRDTTATGETTGDTEGSLSREGIRFGEAHKYKRVRSAIRGCQDKHREAGRAKSAVVYRQHNRKGSHRQAGDSEPEQRGLGDNEEDSGFTPRAQHLPDTPACPGETELWGGQPLQADRREAKLGGSTVPHHREVGSTSGGPLRVHERADIESGDSGVAQEEDTPGASDTLDRESGGTPARGRRAGPGDTSLCMGEDVCAGHAVVARGHMVASSGEATKRVDGTRETPPQGSESVGGAERAPRGLDSIPHSPEGALWSPGTVKKYVAVWEAFQSWTEKCGRAHGDTCENLKEYMAHMAEEKSGNNLETAVRVIITLLDNKIAKEEREDLLLWMKIHRKAANQRNPPILKASDAVKYTDILEMLRRAELTNVTAQEHQALDILIVAFSTMSRAHEIASLKVESVAEDGSFVVVRPKTEAKRWALYKKCVKDGAGLSPATILREKKRSSEMWQSPPVCGRERRRCPSRHPRSDEGTQVGSAETRHRETCDSTRSAQGRGG